MKLRLGIWFFLWPLTGVVAQQLDSVMLEPVVVYGLPEETYLAGSVTQKFDSVFLIQNASSHLGEMLSFQLPVYFRNYGSGMASGISLRGTAPQHTAVLWNGLNINSFSLGQADFSILPAIAFDEVKVYEGGGSARFGSGAFGGAILLASSPVKKTPLTFIQEIGSFGRTFTSLGWNINAERLTVSTKAYHIQSQNDFPIPGEDKRQSHAAYHQEGVVEDVEYRWSSSSTLDLHYWYHQSDRDIQPTIGQYNGSDEQQDRNHRLQVQYRHHSRAGLFNFTTSLIDDVIIYDGSKGEVIRYIEGGDYQHTFNSGIHTQAGFKWNHIQGNIQNYRNGMATENRGDFFGSIQKDFAQRFSLALNVRQPFVEGFQSPFLPYIGFEYTLIKKDDQTLALRSNASKNFRVPTLNDRYWQDAGSLNLLPEESYAFEGGSSWRLHSFELAATFFTQKVDDWIQWVPKSNGTYQPRNVKQVQTKGLEVVVGEAVKVNDHFRLNVRLTYELTESITTAAPESEEYTIGKQLIYTPRHSGSGYISMIWKTWTAVIETQYSGKRYTEASNSNGYALPAFALTDISVSKDASIGRHRFDLRFSLKNITNASYQLFAGRAQPGRNLNIQLVYQLNHQQSI